MRRKRKSSLANILLTAATAVTLSLPMACQEYFTEIQDDHPIEEESVFTAPLPKVFYSDETGESKNSLVIEFLEDVPEERRWEITDSIAKESQFPARKEVREGMDFLASSQIFWPLDRELDKDSLKNEIESLPEVSITWSDFLLYQSIGAPSDKWSDWPTNTPSANRVYWNMHPDNITKRNNWFLKVMGVPLAWDCHKEGEIPLAVLGAGYGEGEEEHEDLYYRWAYKNTYDITGRSVALPGLELPDSTEHDLAVAGLIGAKANNNKGLTGMVLENFDLRLYDAMYNVSESGRLQGVSYMSLENTLNAAINEEAKILVNTQVTPPQSADVVERRFGLILGSHLIQGKDFLFVTSGGNIVPGLSGSEDVSNNGFVKIKDNEIMGEIIGPHILVASASTRDNRHWVGAGSGDLIDFYAPGDEIEILTGINSTRIANGTTLSTALVGGALELIWDFYPSHNSQEVKDYLTKGAEAGGILISDEEGNKAPLVNVYESLKLIAADKDNTPACGMFGIEYNYSTDERKLELWTKKNSSDTPDFELMRTYPVSSDASSLYGELGDFLDSFFFLESRGEGGNIVKKLDFIDLSQTTIYASVPDRDPWAVRSISDTSLLVSEYTGGEDSRRRKTIHIIDALNNNRVVVPPVIGGISACHDDWPSCDIRGFSPDGKVLFFIHSDRDSYIEISSARAPFNASTSVNTIRRFPVSSYGPWPVYIASSDNYVAAVYSGLVDEEGYDNYWEEFRFLIPKDSTKTIYPDITASAFDEKIVRIPHDRGDFGFWDFSFRKEEDALIANTYLIKYEGPNVIQECNVYNIDLNDFTVSKMPITNCTSSTSVLESILERKAMIKSLFREQ